ncbi:hypothetical protein PI124_g16321 [Phytophthora idaei]|nr:hypothetical protein PI124_g16321 [Phytophthora idaei]
MVRRDPLENVLRKLAEHVGMTAPREREYQPVKAPGESGRGNESAGLADENESAGLSEGAENADVGHDQGENGSGTIVGQQGATGIGNAKGHAWRTCALEGANGNGHVQVPRRFDHVLPGSPAGVVAANPGCDYGELEADLTGPRPAQHGMECTYDPEGWAPGADCILMRSIALFPPSRPAWMFVRRAAARAAA